MTVRFFQRLHIRLSMLLLALLLAVFIGLMMMAKNQAIDVVLETAQRANIRLASFIALTQPRDMIAADGKAEVELMRRLARIAYTINPSLEIYLLDPEGRVLAHSIDGREQIDVVVDLVPLRAIAIPSIAMPKFPVLGTDPIRPQRSGVFSAAGLGSGAQPNGYLYVMLGGANSVLGEDMLFPDALRGLLTSTLLILLAAAGALIWVLLTLTRPLRRLTRLVQGFRAGAGKHSSDASGGEIAILDESIRAMHKRIAQQFSRLEEQGQLRRELVGNVSHDLHTPLASIQGYVETLLINGKTFDDDQRTRALKIVLRQAQRLSKRVNDLFELSKLEANYFELNCEPFCLAELAQDVFEAYRLNADKLGIHLKFEAGDCRNVQVWADIAVIERVLQNLIDNAVRHSDQNGNIAVTIFSTPSGEGIAARLCVRISNSGAVIDPADLHHLFDRYWQASDRRAGDDNQSAGLGLAIVKKSLDLHGSSITVTSDPTLGTRFEFDLELAPDGH